MLASPSATLTSCTITGNTARDFGGFNANGAAVQISSSIIAGNTARDFPDFDSDDALSLGYNLFGAVGCSKNDCWQSTDLVNAPPVLAPLALNAGPTYTHLPLPGSLAIDNGAPAGATGAAQRGSARNIDGDCDGVRENDIGSVEAGDPYPLAGYALSFNGSSDYVSAPTTTLGLTNNFTIEAWVRPTAFDDSTGATRIISTRSADGGYSLGQFQDGRLIFTTFGRQDYITAGAFLALDRWNHVAVSFDSSNVVRFYVDGALVETIAGTQPAVASTSPFNIGRNPVAPDRQYWHGYIDEVRVWSTARSHAEIHDAYRQSFNTPLRAWRPATPSAKAWAPPRPTRAPPASPPTSSAPPGPPSRSARPPMSSRPQP